MWISLHQNVVFQFPKLNKSQNANQMRFGVCGRWTDVIDACQ